MKTLQTFLQLHKPVRIGVQIAHCDIGRSQEISDAVESASSGILDSRPVVVILATTDPMKCCTDLRHASHFQCQVVVQVGPACPCQDSSKAPPVFYIGTDELLRVTSSALVEFEGPEVVSSSTTLADQILELFDTDKGVVYWIMGTHELPISESKAISLHHRFREVDVAVVISQQVGAYGWKSFNDDSFRDHINDDECGQKLQLVYLGSAHGPFFECLSQRYFGCLEEKVLCKPGSSSPFHYCSKGAQSFSSVRISFLSVLKNATRVGMIMADRVTETEEVTRRLVKSLLRKQKIVVVQICLDPITDTKLENFADCDCFVFVGCPARALPLIHQARTFRRRVLMPREVLMAFDLVPWTTHFSLAPFSDEEAEMIEGTQVESADVTDPDCVQSLVAVKEGRALAVMGGHELLPVDVRSFRGVNEEGWCEDSRSIHQGKFGVASYYVDEKKYRET